MVTEEQPEPLQASQTCLELPSCELQWLRREAVRAIAAQIAPGGAQSLLGRHLDCSIWPFLRRAIAVPRQVPSIAEAVKLAPLWPIVTILVAAGKYKERVTVDKPVVLLGEGKPSLVNDDGTEPAMVLDYEGEHPLLLKGFDITSSGIAVAVYKGKPTVKGCSISSSSDNGLAVDSTASPSVQGCEFRDSKVAGIALFEDSAAEIRDCVFEANQGYGIYVANRSKPLIVGSTFRSHKGPAISVRHSASGVIKDNKLEKNVGYGIVISGDADVLVEGNEVSGHTMPCIAVRQHAKCTVRNNRLLDNSGMGILVSHDATPLVEGNQVRGQAEPEPAGSKKSGGGRGAGGRESRDDAGNKGLQRAAIAVVDQATGIVRGNRVENNKGYGILISRSARPLVEGNVVSGHKRPAMAIRDEASPEVKDNHFLDNAGYGIVVTHKASPKVQGNKLEGHRLPAIASLDDSAGEISGNVLLGNESYGILVRGGASPLVSGNDLLAQGRAAIATVGKDAKPQLVDNKLAPGVRPVTSNAGDAEPADGEAPPEASCKRPRTD